MKTLFKNAFDKASAEFFEDLHDLGKVTAGQVRVVGFALLGAGFLFALKSSGTGLDLIANSVIVLAGLCGVTLASRMDADDNEDQA